MTEADTVILRPFKTLGDKIDQHSKQDDTRFDAILGSLKVSEEKIDARHLENKAGNDTLIAELQQIKSLVTPLDLIRPELIDQINNRRFRHQMYRLAIVCGKGLGWMAGIIAALYAVAAVDTRFAEFIKWLL